MGSTLIKPKPDEDFYVLYSSVVDSPTGWGTAAELLDDPGARVDQDRLDRTDKTGSSAKWRDPPEHGWQDETIAVREGIDDPTRPEGGWGYVKREDLREFCASLDKGFFCPRPGLVQWEIFTEEDA